MGSSVSQRCASISVFQGLINKKRRVVSGCLSTPQVVVRVNCGEVSGVGCGITGSQKGVGVARAIQTWISELTESGLLVEETEPVISISDAIDAAQNWADLSAICDRIDTAVNVGRDECGFAD